MKSNCKVLIYLVTCLLLLVSIPTYAATFSLSAPWNTAAIGQPFEVSVFLNSDYERINAVQGSVILPANILFLKEIHDGNSIVNLWVERPHLIAGGKIMFSGIIPGGYSGAKGFLFSFIARGDVDANDLISIQDVKALLNDGSGTTAKTNTSSFNFVISESPQSDNLVSPPDVVPPEPFVPALDNSTSVFEGRWFLVFVAQDKGTGINHYEVKEGSGDFTAAESPYLLKYQSLDKNIVVKAVDNAGNSRIAVLPTSKAKPWYKRNLIWIIIIVSLVILAFFKKRHNGVSSHEYS